MAQGGADATSTREALERSVADIARLGPGKGEAHLAAFRALLRGVTHASSGRMGPPSALLADLDPKGIVLYFLAELYVQKKILRKQVTSAMLILLHVPSWLAAFKGDANLRNGLQEDLRHLLEEAVGVEAAASDETDEWPVVPESNANLTLTPRAEKAVNLLKEAVSKMEAMEFSAIDRDEAATVFEKFLRAVLWAVQSPSLNDGAMLLKLEPKERILEFLVDLYERKRKYRARIASALIRLLDFKAWRVLAESNDFLHAAVRDLIVDESDEIHSRCSTAAPVTLRSLVRAALDAQDRGCVGVLHVHVIAAYNLINADNSDMGYHLSDPFVRASLGEQQKRTYIICDDLNPQWRCAPFLFDVPSVDSAIRLDVFDSDIAKDDLLGRLEICVRDVAVRVNDETELYRSRRYQLTGVPHGELEIAVAFVPALIGRPHEPFRACVTQELPGLEAVKTEIPMPACDPERPACWTACAVLAGRSRWLGASLRRLCGGPQASQGG